MLNQGRSGCRRFGWLDVMGGVVFRQMQLVLCSSGLRVQKRGIGLVLVHARVADGEHEEGD